MKVDVPQYDFGWLIGWLEGEGTFHCTISKPVGNRKAYARPVVRACSVDLDTCVRAQSMVEGSRVYGPYKYDSKRQPHWQWGISGKQATCSFMRLIRPHMSGRRQEQIKEALWKATQ